jgi:hypothetical protein
MSYEAVIGCDEVRWVRRGTPLALYRSQEGRPFTSRDDYLTLSEFSF